MIEKEPFRLREWIAPKDMVDGGRLFTCGRPGRGIFGTAKRPINDDVVDKWTQGLIVVGIDVIGQTVVVVDSGGAERTARICKAVGYKIKYVSDRWPRSC